MNTHVLMNTESSTQLITHENKLRRMHKIDPFDQEGNAIELGKRESVVSRQEVSDAGVMVTTLYHELVLTEMFITLAGDFEVRSQWLHRHRIYKDAIGTTMVQRLVLDPELGETALALDAPSRLTSLTGVFSKEASQAITAGLGKNPRSATLAPVIKHYVDTKRHPNTDQGCTVMRALFRAKDAAGIAANAFGAQNVRVDVVKAVGGCQLSHLRLVLTLWDDTMPVDWAVMALRYLAQAKDDNAQRWYKARRGPEARMRFQVLEKSDPGHDFFDHIEESGMDERLLRGLDAPSRKRLLQRQHTIKDTEHFNDTISNLTGLITLVRHMPDLGLVLPTSARNWADLEMQVNNLGAHLRTEHERRELARQEAELDQRTQWLLTENGATWLTKCDAAEQKAQQRRSALREKELAQLSLHQKVLHSLYQSTTDALANTTFPSGFSYQVATERSQLNEWSRTLHNCIAGYSLNVAQTHTLLVGVYERHTIIANVEILMDPDDKVVHVGQIAGKYNDYAVQGHRGAILADLMTLPLLEQSQGE